MIRSLDSEHDADAAEACWDDEIERRTAEVEAGTWLVQLRPYAVPLQGEQTETMTLDEYRSHIRARRAARARR